MLFGKSSKKIVYRKKAILTGRNSAKSLFTNFLFANNQHQI
jgi:hypothetical protein